jgi:hypothetical protein
MRERQIVTCSILRHQSSPAGPDARGTYGMAIG